MQTRFVISVSGGLIEVFSNIADAEVILVDWNLEAFDETTPPTEFACQGQHCKAFVEPFPFERLPSSPLSFIGRALEAKGYKPLASRPTIGLSDRELATTLAALRYWQSRLIEGEDSLLFCTEHFDEQMPLSVMEVSDLCERLNENNPATRKSCACQAPGYFNSNIPGVLAHAEQGFVAAKANVERCDQCEIYPNDAEARTELFRL